MQCSVMQETQSCTGAHFAFCLPEFELEPHAFLQTGSLKTCRRLFLWTWNSTKSFSGWHLVWLPPQTCQSFLPCSVVGHNEPTSIPLFRLCLQTRKLSLDGFVDQRPLFLCVILHLHISRKNILGWIRIFKSRVKFYIEDGMWTHLNWDVTLFIFKELKLLKLLFLLFSQHIRLLWQLGNLWDFLWTAPHSNL